MWPQWLDAHRTSWASWKLYTSLIMSQIGGALRGLSRLVLSHLSLIIRVILHTHTRKCADKKDRSTVLERTAWRSRG